MYLVECIIIIFVKKISVIYKEGRFLDVIISVYSVGYRRR